MNGAPDVTCLRDVIIVLSGVFPHDASRLKVPHLRTVARTFVRDGCLAGELDTQ